MAFWLQGESEVRNPEVYSSQARLHQPDEASKVGNSAWVKYSARFYRRRWLVLVLAATYS